MGALSATTNLSVKLTSSMGRSSRSTDARGGASGSSATVLSNVSGPPPAVFRSAAVAAGTAPFWIVLARWVRVAGADAVTSWASTRGNDLVMRSGLGRRPTSLVPAGAMKLSVKLPNMVSIAVVAGAEVAAKRTDRSVWTSRASRARRAGPVEEENSAGRAAHEVV